MNRYEYLDLLFDNMAYPVAVLVFLMILAIMAWNGRLGLVPALYFPFYMPASISLATAILLSISNKLDPGGLLYIAIVTLLTLVLLQRVFNRRLLVSIKSIFENLPIHKSVKLLKIASVFSILHSSSVLLSTSEIGGSSRIAYLYLDGFQRIITPLTIILNAILLALLTFFLAKGKTGLMMTTFTLLLFATIATRSKGSSFISLLTAFYLAKSIGFSPIRILIDSLNLKQSRSFLFRLLFIFVLLVLFTLIFTLFIIAQGQSINLLLERLFQNADSVFMYFPDYQEVSDKICKDLGFIAPLHRGIGGFLGNELARDPATIFGIALNGLIENLSSPELIGPNAQLPSWSHCYYGSTLGIVISALLCGTYMLICYLNINFKQDPNFMIAWAFTLYSASSFFQEVSVLTSVLAQLAIIVCLYGVKKTIFHT